MLERRNTMQELLMLTVFTLFSATEGFSNLEILTVEQRRAIFGTDTSVHLPPIELVSLQQLNADNLREFGKRPYSVLEYKLTKGGEEIRLTLRPNANFIAPGCFVRHYQKNGTVSISPCGSESLGCFYTGHSDSHKDTWINVNACQGLKGMVTIANTSYVIAPLHTRSSRHHGNGTRDAMNSPGKTGGNHDNSTHMHVVYRYRSDKTVCRTEDHPHTSAPLHIVHSDPTRQKRGVQQDHGAARDVHKTKAKRAATQQTKYIETRVVIDPKMYEFHGDQAEDYVLTLFNIASRSFADRSIEDSIKLMLTEIIIYESYDSIGIEVTADAKKTVSDVCRWLADNVTSSDPDCNVMLTRLNLEMDGADETVGLATTGAVCRPGTNCAIVEDIGPTSGSVIAHEIGHLLGMSHDESAGCDNVTGIMTRIANGGTQYTWSKCSVRALKEFFRTSDQTCLQNEPVGLHLFSGFNKGRPLPGTVMTRDQQCRLLKGRDWTACGDVHALNATAQCLEMRCRAPGKDESCTAVFSASYADGTDCNNTRAWCMSGRCVAMDADNSVVPVHGAWSDWDADYSPCSRTCGGGVRMKRRTCTSPPPQYGGNGCVGDDIQAVMCNMQRCDKDYKETQCLELDSRLFNGSSYNWVPVDHSIGHGSCAFTCVTLGNKQLVRTDTSPFRDGTGCVLGPKSPYGRCIDGVCREFGCDGVLESGIGYGQCGICYDDDDVSPSLGEDDRDCYSFRKEFGCDGVLESGIGYDQCGICDGTGMGCRHMSGNYTSATPAKNFTTIQVIPRDSFGIKIKQHNKNCFLSVLIRGQRILNDNPQDRRSNTYVVDDVTIRYNRFPETMVIIGPPTTSDIEIQVYSLTNATSPHVHYEYHRATDDRIMQYTWATRLTSCSKSCGTGTMTPLVQCVNFTGPVEDYLCDLSKKPNEVQRPCNNFFCPPAWKFAQLSDCSKSCGPGGIRTRSVYCAKKNNGTERRVPSAVCHSDGSYRPPSVVTCSNGPCPGLWKTGNWSACSKTCGRGFQTRTVRCYQNINDTLPAGERFCPGLKPPARQQECTARVCASDQYNCTDLKTNCREYGLSVCFGDYAPWAAHNCPRFCKVCSIGNDHECNQYVDAHVNICVSYPAWAKQHCPLYCKDSESECRDKAPCETFDTRFGNVMCRSPTYHSFVNKNCRKYCNLCGGATDQCMDKKSNCAGYTTAPCRDPRYMQFMTANCAKFCGFC